MMVRKPIILGITESGQRESPVLSVPWKKTSSALKMRPPDTYVSPQQLHMVSPFDVKACYISAEPQNFSFLNRYTSLEALYINNGRLLTDLSFVENMPNLTQLYIKNAHLPNLDPIVDIKERLGSSAISCLGLCKCTIDDISSLIQSGRYFSELLIWANTTELIKWRPMKERINGCNLYVI